MTKFFIGDTVKVINNGANYTTYQEWADKHGMAKYIDKCHCPNKGTIATVVAIGSHLRDNAILTGIRTESGQEYILGEWGLELVSRVNLKDMLTNGRRVKLRNNIMYTYIDGYFTNISPVGNGLVYLSEVATWADDLHYYRGVDVESEWDVVEIFAAPNIYDYFNYKIKARSLWTRKEKSAKQLQLEALQKQAQEVADAIKNLQDEE